jgi:hypothetical protein
MIAAIFIMIAGYIVLHSIRGLMDHTKMVMGGRFFKHTEESEENNIITVNEEVEEYFRPSDLPVLNNRNFSRLFTENYFDKKVSEIVLPEYFMETPQETIINYFSVLREAANWQKGKNAGCGTLGRSKTPYPTAYHFLSSGYRNKTTYEQYLDSFLNILHINLLKYKEVPVFGEASDTKRYFIEIETIEGSDKDVAYFAYYYGFIDLVKEGNRYEIDSIEYHGENYLCAPYHGWAYDAQMNVAIRYGNWCSLIKEKYPMQQEGYVKKILFQGTDGYDYMIEFFQLTNDTDIEIAQYRKKDDGNWELIKLDPEKCLDNDMDDND